MCISKTLLNYLLSLSLFILFAGCLNPAGIPVRPENIVEKELLFSPKEPERFELNNGLVVLYAYDPELPLMQGTLYLPGGSLYDPDGLVGLADAVGSQMRDGGISGLSPDLLDRRLDDLAANIDSGYGDEYGQVSFSCLSEDFSEVFDLFNKVVREPRFDAFRLSLWKQLSLDSIRRRQEDPDTIATMTFRELVYGKGSPFARWKNASSIEHINVEAMRKFHGRFVRPDGARLAIWGSLPRGQVYALIGKYFSDWKKGKEELPKPPIVDSQINPGIYLVDKQFSQAAIVIGHLGPPRNTDDRYAMGVFNYMFGWSGFSSVLFKEVRTNLGLAYSVWGGLVPSLSAGTFQVRVGTRVAKAPKAASKVIQLIQRSKSVIPSVANVEDAKRSIKRSFVFKFSSAGSRVSRKAKLEMLGFPKDYDRMYLRRIERVNPVLVSNVPKKWIDPDKLIIVVVGDVSVDNLRREFIKEMPVYLVKFVSEPEAPTAWTGNLEDKPVKN